MQSHEVPLNAPAELEDLITELLAEPFARENQFADLDLDQVGRLLEEGREALAEMDGSAAIVLARVSHEKCVSLYCVILMEMESRKIPDLINKTLLELSRQESGTDRIETAKAIPTAHALPEEESTTEEISIVTEGTFTREDTVETIPGISLTELRKPEPDSGPPEPEETFSLEEASPIDPVEDRFYEENMTPRGSPFEKELRPMMDKFVSQRAKDHLELALYFQLVKGGSFPFDPEHADRLSGQSFCFALESETTAKVLPTVRAFWSEREAAIRALLDAGNRRFELHPILKKTLDHLAKSHVEWLPDGRFPYVSALSSLRYILATLQPEAFHPSPLETGLLLFLFGQNEGLDGVRLHNHFAAEGLTSKEMIELTFRLARVQRIRNKILSADSKISAEELDGLQKDAVRVFELFANLRFGEKGRGEKQAA